MGAYAPVQFVTDKMMEQIKSTILDRTLKGIKSENLHYVGVLYFGLMLTPEGPKVLEYNCRFGDPETQAILPLLVSDLAEIMLACCHGRLRDFPLRWKQQSSCCIVMASPGYPGTCQTGIEIHGLEKPTALVFHAATKKNNGRVVSSGGRVLGITGIGSSLQEATQNAYQGIKGIKFPTSHYRTDIGTHNV
jgi:phosphoribosylamine--glycine ligase